MFRPELPGSAPAAALATAHPTPPPAHPPGPVVVSVCSTCRAAEGEPPDAAGLIAALRTELAADAGAVTVRPVQCLGVCKRPLTVAVSAPDGFTFMFGDLDVAAGADALARFVRAYGATDYGFVPWRVRAEVLRRGLVARLPPAAWSPEDGRAPA